MPDPAPAHPAAPPHRPARGWLHESALQSLLIVLSVALGFAVNEWGQRRTQRDRAVQALAAVRAELAANRAAAAASQAHHRLVHDTLSAYVRAGRLPPERVYYLMHMFSPAPLLGTAWASARESRATDELPYPLVLQLARAYDWQDRYRALSDAVVSGAYGDMLRRGGPAVFRDGYANFDLLARDFADRERDLVARYDSALAAVGRARVR